MRIGMLRGEGRVGDELNSTLGLISKNLTVYFKSIFTNVYKCGVIVLICYYENMPQTTSNHCTSQNI